jgi:beta-galactosidase
MRALLSLVLLILLIIQNCEAQNPDSLRELIKTMSFEIPVLSPVPSQVCNTQTPVISLNGTWKFNTENPDLKLAKDIEVPGEWVMQGFDVKKDKAATYWKSFTIPADWKGNRIKIRFDGVSSHALVKVNGKQVGTHEGSFVAFEFDITDAVQPGENLLEVEVQCETISDILACTSQYAAHPVGGILRKVTLFTLPQVNISDFAWSVKFDTQYRDATLNFNGKVVFNSQSAKQLQIQFELKDARGNLVPLDKNTFSILVKNTLGEINCGMNVKSPEKWDPEHPNLYLLTTSLIVDGKTVQSNTQKIGFRQIELRGNQFFVNNQPIKLKGVNHHEVHPLRGRSLTPELCRKDVELFRAGNCNYLRTSHYPPSEELLQACDELGMFVESEASLCWIEHGASPIWKTWNYLDTQYLPYMVRADLENVLSGRQHPSVIIWSLGNESRWSPLWERVNAEVKKLDPARPTSFHDQCWGDYNNAGSKADIANYHYPGLNGPRECEKEKSRPTMFGEYMHVQCYARRELETDPSVRSDAYSRTLKQMVDSVYQYPACMGGAIWSGIDDIFHLSSEKICGYGPWGPVDGWRREKPEYIGMKKSYSPVVITNLKTVKPVNGILELQIENRYNFFNLCELKITARVGDRILPVQADIAPLSKGSIKIDLAGTLPSKDVLISFFDPRGFTCEQELIRIGEPEMSNQSSAKVEISLSETESSFIIKSGSNKFALSRLNGVIESITRTTGRVVSEGAEMTLITHNEDDGGAPGIAGNTYNQDIKPLEYAPLDGFMLSKIKAEKLNANSVLVSVEGTFGKQLSGNQQYLFNGDGTVSFSYDYKALTDFTEKNKNLLRQFGLMFTLPASFDELSWKRTGLWTVYPEYDPNRLDGTTKANPRNLKYVEEPLEVPDYPWKESANKLGCNDFKGTKENIICAKLQNAEGTVFKVSSDGNQHARAWVDGDKIRFLVAGLNGPGSCYFFTGPRPEFRKGEHLSGKFTLEIK